MGMTQVGQLVVTQFIRQDENDVGLACRLARTAHENSQQQAGTHGCNETYRAHDNNSWSFPDSACQNHNVLSGRAKRAARLCHGLNSTSMIPGNIHRQTLARHDLILYRKPPAARLDKSTVSGVHHVTS
jgi:hypothetical protein